MSYHHEISLPASPRRIYDILTGSAEFSAATEQRAVIGDAEGESFELFEGHIVGRQIELEPGKRIVQAWRFPDWAPGVYTMVRFGLASEGDGTKLTLDQEGIPEGVSPIFPTWQAHVEAGWPMFYFGPLQKYLAA